MDSFGIYILHVIIHVIICMLSFLLSYSVSRRVKSRQLFEHPAKCGSYGPLVFSCFGFILSLKGLRVWTLSPWKLIRSDPCCDVSTYELGRRWGWRQAASGGVRGGQWGRQERMTGEDMGWGRGRSQICVVKGLRNWIGGILGCM